MRIFYEVYGSGDQTVLLLPTWSIIHSRHWKAQIPYLARHARVVTFDGRGNGRSDRPATVDAYAEREFAADALAVMDATGTERAVVVGLSAGALWGVLLAAEHPERVDGAVFIAPASPFGQHLARVRTPFDEPLESYEGWAKYNRHYWLEDYRDFLEFFFGQVFTEPHSTKQIEDCVGWGLETTGETLALTYRGPRAARPRRVRRALPPDHVPRAGHPRHRRRGPAGRGRRGARGGDRRGVRRARGLRALPARARPGARQPAAARLRRAPAGAARAGRADAGAASARSTSRRRSGSATRGATSRSPASCAALHPDLEIDWLAQHPVTAALEAAGERVHPASRELANESHHIESESAEHDLHCFQAWRRMDEILVANFMVFHDLVSETDYDLWIADEGWEIDYYLHENPEQKRAAYAWLTDFVGWLPMPDGGEHEAAAHRRLQRRDDRAHRSLPARARPRDLRRQPRGHRPRRRSAPTCRRSPTGPASTSTSPATSPGSTRPSSATASGCARSSGTGRREQVCIVTVGGSGVGRSLLERVMAAFPEAKRARPRAAHDRRRRPAHRPGVAAGARRPRGPRLRPRPLPPPGRVRPRRRAGRPDDLDGADRQPAAVPLLPAAPPLRAEHPRAPPARALRRRAAHGLRDRDARGRSPRRSPRRSGARSTTGRSRPTAPPARRHGSPSCSDLRPPGARRGRRGGQDLAGARPSA